MSDVIVRRPIASLTQPIVESGIVPVTSEQPLGDGETRVVMYAVLQGDIAVVVEPADGGTWKMKPVPDRLKPMLWSRYSDRKLSFPDDTTGAVSRSRPVLPLQDVNPQRINLVYTGGDLPKLQHRRGQILDGGWDQEVANQSFVESVPYRILQSRFVAGAEWQDIDGVGAMPAEEVRKEVLAAIDGLYQAIKSEGYRRQRDLGGADDDEILVGLRRDGRYVLLSGAKRLAIARLLGLATIPVNVVVRHAKWEAERSRIVNFAAKHEGRIYQRVRHPDLLDLQAHHDEDRLPIIARALGGYDPRGKTLVDIGAHWGQMSAAMEDLGFNVTAVEANSQSARFIAVLRDAMEYRFDVWEGSIFEFPRISEQKVVLALNIFHHFLKAKETFDGLSSMLSRLDADILIFAAHVYERRGPDFKNAYQNFRPDEFAAFVSRLSRLPNIELVGKSHDGRNLYKLSR